MRLLSETNFGAGGNDVSRIGAGWGDSEAGFRWTLGVASALVAAGPDGEGSIPAADGDLLLDFDVSAFVPAAADAGCDQPAQRLTVSVNGVRAGQLLIGGRGRAGLIVRSPKTDGGALRLVFEHPDASSPAACGLEGDDWRQLGICFHRLRVHAVPRSDRGSDVAEQAVPVDDAARAALVSRFESLGDNCEFGLVQRRAGAEPLGLLRFSNIALPDLVRAVETGFRHLGDPSNLECWPGGGERPEHVLRDRAYMLVFHTFQHVDGIAADTLLAQQTTRLRFLRRKLLEDMEAGEKIFVLRRNRGHPLAEQDVLPLVAALAAHGPAILLWVAPADAAHRSGSVERIMPGLLRGRVDRLAPDDDAHDLSYAAWLQLCANAVAAASLDSGTDR